MHYLLIVTGKDIAEQMEPWKESFEPLPEGADDPKGYGELYKGFWDWYVIGGRWNGLLKLKAEYRGQFIQLNEDLCINDTNTAPKYAVDLSAFKFASYAILNNGTLHTREIRTEHGWYDGEKSQDEWTKEWKAVIDSLPEDTLLTIVDYHA